MTKKLTKNDSMCNSAKDFDTIVAAFEAFLKRKRAHRSYFQEWKKHHRHTSTSSVFNEWREWARPNVPECWINAGFIWRGTNQRYDYWYKISRAWFLWCKKNLKK